MPVVKEQKQAAARLGVTPRALRDWELDPSFPPTSRGYDLDKIKAWVAVHEKKGSQTAAESSKLTLAHKALKVKKEQLLVQRFEREEQIAQGNVLPRDEIETSLREIISVARDQFLRLPEVSARLVPQDVQAAVTGELKRQVAKILDGLQRMIDGLEYDSHQAD